MEQLVQVILLQQTQHKALMVEIQQGLTMEEVAVVELLVLEEMQVQDQVQVELEEELVVPVEQVQLTQHQQQELAVVVAVRVEMYLQVIIILEEQVVVAAVEQVEPLEQ
jgi:hypothetical protein